MDRISFVQDVTAVVELADHGGLSGALLQRATCRDGQSLIVKRSSRGTDLFMHLLGGDTARELRLWERGVLAELPPEVEHAIVGGWTDPAETVLLMEDLGGRILGSSPPMTDAMCCRLVTSITAMHRKFRSNPPDDLAPLDAVITTFAPQRLNAVAPEANALVATVRRGWEEFARLTPPAFHQDFAALLRDPAPLVVALRRQTPTLCHGDLAPVNFAWSRRGGVILIDWAQAVAAPAEFDIARFALGCGTYAAPDISKFVDDYATFVGSDFDPVAMNLALLAALLWFGWAKAIAITDADTANADLPPPFALSWWIDRAASALASL